MQPLNTKLFRSGRLRRVTIRPRSGVDVHTIHEAEVVRVTPADIMVSEAPSVSQLVARNGFLETGRQPQHRVVAEVYLNQVIARLSGSPSCGGTAGHTAGYEASSTAGLVIPLHRGDWSVDPASDPIRHNSRQRVVLRSVVELDEHISRRAIPIVRCVR